MKNKTAILLLSALAAMTLVIGCRHELMQPPGGSGINPPPATSACSPDSVYFFNEIQPIISSNCTMSGCHDNITHADGVNLTTYANIMRYVQAGNASESKLFKVIIRTDEERMPPPPRSPLSQLQKDKIYKWINKAAAITANPI